MVLIHVNLGSWNRKKLKLKRPKFTLTLKVFFKMKKKLKNAKFSKLYQKFFENIWSLYSEPYEGLKGLRFKLLTVFYLI